MAHVAKNSPVEYRFRYFKGFADAVLRLSEPVTVVIGRNGAGKSNLIEGIELYSELVRGRALREISEAGRGASFEVRGGLAACPSVGERWFQLGSRVDGVQHEVAIRPEAMQVEAESLLDGETMLFEVADTRESFRSREVQVDYAAHSAAAEDTRTLRLVLPADRIVFASYPGFAFARSAARATYDNIDEVKRQISAAFSLTPSAQAMRGYVRPGLALSAEPLGRDAANISGVLHSLIGTTTLIDLAKHIGQLPEESFSAIEFVEVPNGDVMLGLRIGEEGPLIDARLLSDGTLRYLALLAALETLPEGSLILIEDLDAGLHPSRVTTLVRRLHERCAVRGLRALVTTHSPTVLDTLTIEQLRGVVVCYRDTVRRTAALCPLLQIADVDVLLERGGLGDLVTRQVLEQHLLPGFSVERRQRALSWLESLP